MEAINSSAAMKPTVRWLFIAILVKNEQAWSPFYVEISGQLLVRSVETCFSYGLDKSRCKNCLFLIGISWLDVLAASLNRRITAISLEV